MPKHSFEAIINRILSQVIKEGEVDPRRAERTMCPQCAVDLETYNLLVTRTGGSGYGTVITTAIRKTQPILTAEQIGQVIAAVKIKRSGGQFKNVRTKIGKSELEWVNEMASGIQTKPGRVLEAILFLYLRAEGEET